MKLFVANFPFSLDRPELSALFERFGEVSDCRIIRHYESGRSRGFAFVEMPNEEQARDALGRLHGRTFQGRELRVHDAQEQGPAAVPASAIQAATPSPQNAATGYIRVFDKDRLTGRIRTDNGFELFFHNNDFRGVWPEPSTRVIFDIAASPRGLQAVAVRPL